MKRFVDLWENNYEFNNVCVYRVELQNKLKRVISKIIKLSMKIKRLIVGEFNTNCYLLLSKNELGIIDPGGDKEKILKALKKLKVKPKYIINTHYHFDHTLFSAKLKELTQAEIIIHEDEKKYIDFKADKFLGEGDEVKIGNLRLKVVHTPGHTPGSFCLREENFIFTGDTLFKDGYGRTDLSGGSEADMQASLKKLSKIIKPGMMVYPGHGEFFKFNSA